MKDNINPVTAWLLAHSVTLSVRRALDFRLLPPGTYTHRTFAFGASRSGITDGVHTILAVTNADGVGTRTVEVMHANLDVRLDAPPAPYRPRKQRDSEPRGVVGAKAVRNARLDVLIQNLADLL